MHNGYNNLNLLMDLNWDRALYLAIIVLALGAGAWIIPVIG